MIKARNVYREWLLGIDALRGAIGCRGDTRDPRWIGRGVLGADNSWLTDTGAFQSCVVLGPGRLPGSPSPGNSDYLAELGEITGALGAATAQAYGRYGRAGLERRTALG